jgi:hypothetical protein
MTIHALINGSTVVNVIEASAEFVTSIAGQYQRTELLSPAALAQGVGVGWTWTGVGAVPFAPPPAPPTPPAPPPPPYLWFIDPGSFRDRFGATKMVVLGATDPTIQVLLKDLDGRPWVDLQRQDVVQGLAYIGSVIPAVTPQLQTQILTTQPTAFEQLVLRSYFK